MAVKANWQNGEQFNASDANAVAEAVNNAYVKPATGVPITDLTASVQLSLGKADSAVQSVAAADITDSTSTGRAVLKAQDASAARTAIGVAYGTTAGTVAEGNDSRFSPSSTSITDSTATGRSLITATDAAAARTTLGVSYGTTSGTVAQGNDSRITGAQQTSQKGQANGYAELDGAGKVPVTQLPSSVMEYQGTYNASTGSPTLADGTGNAGDVYRVSVAGTRDFGSGSITLRVGDYVIYSGSVWQKSATTDTVASVAGLTGDVSAASLRSALGGARSNATITTPTTLDAAAGTDYIYWLSGVTTNVAESVTPGDSLYTSTICLLHAEGSNGSTTITDSSAVALPWTVGGNAQISTAQKKFGNSSLLFDGNFDFIIPTASSHAFAFQTYDFTIEMWVYPTAFSTAVRAIYDSRPNGITNGAYPTIYLNGTGGLRYYTTGADRIAAGSNLTLNTWQHIAVCRSGTSTRLFIDGVQSGSTFTDTTNYIQSDSRPRIGSDASGDNANSFVGYMDEIRVTKAARYAANFTAPTSAFLEVAPVTVPASSTYAPANSTLPTAVGNANVYTLKNIYESTVTVNTTAGQTVEGKSSFQISPGQSFNFASDGSNWRII